MLRERISYYRKVADQTTDPMARILVADKIAMFEEMERLETLKHMFLRLGGRLGFEYPFSR